MRQMKMNVDCTNETYVFVPYFDYENCKRENEDDIMEKFLTLILEHDSSRIGLLNGKWIGFQRKYVVAAEAWFEEV